MGGFIFERYGGFWPGFGLSLGDGVIYPQRAMDEEAHTLLGGGRGHRWSDEPSDIEPSATLTGLGNPQPPP